MRTLFRTLLILCAVAFIAVIGILGIAVVFGPKMIPKTAGEWVEANTGFDLKINNLELYPLRGKVIADGIALLNPKNYDENRFVSLDRVLVDVKPMSVFSDTYEAETVEVDLKSLYLVKNEQGNYNAKEFLAAINKLSQSDEAQAESNDPEATQASAASKSHKAYKIKKLILAVKSVKYVGDSGKVKDFDLNYRKEFTNVQDFKKVGAEVAKDMSGLGVALVATVIQDAVPDIIKDLTVDTLINEAVGGVNPLPIPGVGGAAADPIKKGVKGLFDALKN